MSDDAERQSAHPFALTAGQLAASVPGSSSGIFDDARAMAASRPIPPPTNVHVGRVIPVASLIHQPVRGRLEYLGGYMTLEEWLSGAVRARGIEIPPDFWLDYFASQHSCAEMLAAIATLSRLAQPDKQHDLIHAVRSSCTTDLLRPLDDALAKEMTRVFLCRQGLLLAAKTILRRNEPAKPPSPVPPLFAAALLSQAILDKVEPGEMQPAGVELFPSMDAALAIQVYRNYLFQATSEAVTTLDLTRRLWVEHPPAGDAALPKAPAELFEDATGLAFEAFIELGYMLWAAVSPVPTDKVPALYQWDQYPFDPTFLARALTFIGATPDQLVAALDASPGGDGPWDVLGFEEHPVILLPAHPPLVLDEILLWRRFLDGPFYAVLDHQRDTGGEKASRAWTKAYGSMVEQAARAALPELSVPLLLSGERAYWDGDAVKAAFGGDGRKTADGVLLVAREAMVAEVVSSGPTLSSRILGDLAGFSAVMERQVWAKVEQLDQTARDMFEDDRRLTGWPEKVTTSVRPLLVQGGAFPYMPVTRSYIDAECSRRGRLQDERTKPLLIVELDELEMLLAVTQATAKTLAQLLDEWDSGPRRTWPVKNHLLAAYSDLEARLRPEAVTRSIEAAFDTLARRAQPDAGGAPSPAGDEAGGDEAGGDGANSPP